MSTKQADQAQLSFQGVAAKLELISKICAIATALVLPLSTSLTDGLFVVTIVLYFLSGNLSEKISFISQNRVALFLLAFFALFIVGITYTTAPLNGVLLMMVKYDKVFFAALLLPLFREEVWRRYAINAFLFSISVALFFSYLKYFGIITYGAHYGQVEIFRDHIPFSFFMSFAAYLIALRLTTEKITRHNWWLLIPLCLLIYNVFFMGMGRAGYFTFAGLLTLLFVQKIGWRGLSAAFVLVTLLFGSAYTFSNIFKDRINAAVFEAQTYQRDTLSSVGLRISFVKNSVDLIKAHPIFGSGTGSFRYEYAKIKPAPVILTHNPHNEYLHIGVQFGLLGIFMLLLLFGAQLRYSYLLADVSMRNIAQAVVVSVIIGNCANSWLLDTATGHFYAYFIAIAFASLPKSDWQRWLSKK